MHTSKAKAQAARPSDTRGRLHIKRSSSRFTGCFFIRRETRGENHDHHRIRTQDARDRRTARIC